MPQYPGPLSIYSPSPREEREVPTSQSSSAKFTAVLLLSFIGDSVTLSCI